MAKKGIKNNIWKKLVRAKVQNQSTLLKHLNSPSTQRLNRLASNIKIGDLENIEAQAAQIYWPALFGKNFRRDRNAEGINILLNYGYTILRSSMTKAIITAGLHPTFGVFHKNKKNPFCLVDDLMEPYRPLVDQVVKRLEEKNKTELSPIVKRCLAAIVQGDHVSDYAVSPLFQHMSNLSFTFWETLIGNKTNMAMPTLLSEIEVEAITSK